MLQLRALKLLSLNLFLSDLGRERLKSFGERARHSEKGEGCKEIRRPEEIERCEQTRAGARKSEKNLGGNQEAENLRKSGGGGCEEI